MKLIQNYYYNEYSDTYNKIKHNSPSLTEQQIKEILDGFDEWNEYLFNFYDNGDVEVVDYFTNQTIQVDDLVGLPYDFVHRKCQELYQNKVS